MSHMAKENNQDGNSKDGNEPDSEWEMLDPDEAPVCLGKKYFIIRTGITMDTHEVIINRLKCHRPDLEEVSHVDECDFILLFCPIVSRAGTDVEAAMQALYKTSDTKPAAVMVLHHTFDPECVLPNISPLVNRPKTVVANWRFHEDVGLLQCPKNDKSLVIVVNQMPNQVPVQGICSGIVTGIVDALRYYTSDITALLYWGRSFVLDIFLEKTGRLPVEQGQRRMQEQLRLVLIGRTGSAKSAALNTILGIKERNQAATSTATSSSTQPSESTHVEVAGRKVTLVETPDWFSSELPPDNLRKDVGHYIHLSAPGPHAFLLVISVNQPKGEEKGVLGKMEECFGEECWKNTVILFTVTGAREKQEVQTFIQSGNQELRELVEKCEYRFHCLDIKESADNAQVSELLEKVEEMVDGSGMQFYSSEVYQGFWEGS